MKMRAYCDRGLLLATVLVLAGVAGCWSEEAVYSVTDLGTLGGSPGGCRNMIEVPSGFGREGLNDMNNSGQVVGVMPNTSDEARAFLWLPAAAYGLPAGLNDLGTLGGTTSVAYHINEAGQILGEAATADGEGHFFLWEDGDMTDLGEFDQSRLTAILIEYKFDHQSVPEVPLLIPGLVWANGVLLYTEPYTDVWVMAMNDSGQATGSAWTGFQQERQGLVWKWGWPIKRPSRLISAQPGWELQEPMFITASGQIVGCGTFEGETRYFLAEP